MKQSDPQPPMQLAPTQSISVYRSRAFRVTEGANLGDAQASMDELVLDDVYQLGDDATRHRLAIETLAEGGFRIAPDTETGRAGAPLHLDCALTLMSPDGHHTEALVLVEVDELWLIAEVYLLPLAPLAPRTDYRLVGIDRAAARRRFAEVACVSFTRGTRITMATGAQVPIEDLQIGDRVLTRDDGPQQVRWIGHSTVRASGEFAPIVIRAGTLNNQGDLVVSPNHRLFVYQRHDEINAGRPELLVRASHLINGDSVTVREGGFVDYFQLLFDSHHIIYAEGIAAESMLIDPRTRPALPADLLDRLGALLPGHDASGLKGLDVQKALLDRPDAIDLLRRASLR